MLGESFPPYGLAFVEYTPPEFPRELRATGIASGYSVIVATIDVHGRIEDAVAIEASHPAFAEAVIEAASAWTLAPTSAATSPRREVLHYVFQRSGVVSGLSHLEGARAAFSNPNGHPRVRTVPASSLTPPPQRLSGKRPVVVESTLAPGETGHAVVGFIIDEKGRVRVPAVTEASDPALGEAALAAIKTWRFARARVGGQPVLVEAIRSFRFESQDVSQSRPKL